MTEHRIIQGDCIEVMSGFDDGSFDIMFTSPPFKEEDVEGDYWQFYDRFFQQAQRVTSKVICIIHSSTKLNTIIRKYPPHRTMIRSKGVSQYSYRWNPIYLYQQSEDYKINKYIWCDVFGVQAITGQWKAHAYQDPPVLYRTIIGMFKGCETCIDPFMGSGTTLEACRQVGIDCTGIDLNSDHCSTTKERLQQSELRFEQVPS